MRIQQLTLYGGVVAVSLFASYFGAQRDRGRKTFVLSWLGSLIRFSLGDMVAFSYFLLSTLMSPDWKGAAKSPYECLMETKLWLTPLALWAWISFYCVSVIRVRHIRSWMTLGLFTGCIGSVGCALLLTLSREPKSSDLESLLFLLLLTPLIYLPIWYGLLAAQAQRATQTKFINYCSTFAGQIALWLWAAEKSVETYNALPNYQACYVVTASTHGYPWLVRPLIWLDENGQQQLETRQLRRFRNFERVWRDRWPVSHRRCRQCYNIVGPILARRIRTPFLASLSYLALKPLEWMTALICRDTI